MAIQTLSKKIVNKTSQSLGYFAAIATSLFVPFLVFAQNAGFNTDSKTGWVGCDGPECDWTAFVALVSRIMRNGYILAFFVLVIMIAYAGFLILTSGADASKRTKARSVVTGVVIGMIVMFFSYAIVVYVLRTLGVEAEFFQLLEF